MGLLATSPARDNSRAPREVREGSEVPENEATQKERGSTIQQALAPEGEDKEDDKQCNNSAREEPGKEGRNASSKSEGNQRDACTRTGRSSLVYEPGGHAPRDNEKRPPTKGDAGEDATREQGQRGTDEGEPHDQLFKIRRLPCQLADCCHGDVGVQLAGEGTIYPDQDAALVGVLNKLCLFRFGHVSVANGQRMTCQRLARQLHWG